MHTGKLMGFFITLFNGIFLFFVYVAFQPATNFKRHMLIPLDSENLSKKLYLKIKISVIIKLVKMKRVSERYPTKKTLV